MPRIDGSGAPSGAVQDDVDTTLAPAPDGVKKQPEAAPPPAGNLVEAWDPRLPKPEQHSFPGIELDRSLSQFPASALQVPGLTPKRVELGGEPVRQAGADPKPAESRWSALTSALRDGAASAGARLSGADLAQQSTALADTLGELRANVETTKKAFESLGKAKDLPGGAGLEGLSQSAERISSALGKVASAVGDAEAAARIPEATRELNSAFDAYQQHPTVENAERLKAATEAWRAAIVPFASKIPDQAVRAQVLGMLEIASKAVGNFAVLVSNYVKRAEDASRTDMPVQLSPTTWGPTPAQVEAAGQIAASDGDGVCHSVAEMPAFIDQRMDTWLARTGRSELPADIQSDFDEVRATAVALAANRAARANPRNFFKRDELDQQAHELKMKLAASISRLDAELGGVVRLHGAVDATSGIR